MGSRLSVRRVAGLGFAVGASVVAVPGFGAGALPTATQTVPATAEECAVWRRERAFAASVEAHDAAAFASHLHPDAVFDAGAATADRGRAAVEASWAAIVAGRGIDLRWRPGIVQIAGNARVALSKGPYILETERDGARSVRVGFYQTVWVKDDPTGAWRVLYDAPASTPRPVRDRAEAEAWVREQAMSACAD